MSVLYNRLANQTRFLPSVHGFPFMNRFGLKEAVGMVYQVLDSYYNGIYINRKLEKPGIFSDFRDSLETRASSVHTSALSDKMNSWLYQKTPQERYDETWALLDSLNPLGHPRIVFILVETGTLVRKRRFRPVIVHHMQETPFFRLYTYNPYLTTLDDENADSFDNSNIICFRERDPSEAIGNIDSVDFYGLFEHPYDHIIPSTFLNVAPSIESTNREIQTSVADDMPHRVDSVRISVNWEGSIIPYYNLFCDEIDNYRTTDDLYLKKRNGVTEVYTLKDLITLFSVNGEYYPSLGKRADYYILKETSGTMKFVYRTIVTSEYLGRLIQIFFTNTLKRLRYYPPKPSIEAAFYTRWPDDTQMRYSDSNEILWVKAAEVKVRTDYDESLHGEIPLSQTVFVSGSYGALEWQRDASLEENLFGAGAEVGYICDKLNCTRREKNLLNPRIRVKLSLWQEHPGHTDPVMMTETYPDVTEMDTFCINDLFANSNPNTRIADGFRDIDFDINAYIHIRFDASDDAEQTANRECKIHARSNLLFSGIEPPHLGYIEIDLREWILGPYLKTFVKELGFADIHGAITENRSKYVEEATRRISPILAGLSKEECPHRGMLLGNVHRFRELYLAQIQSYLRTSKHLDRKSFTEKSKTLRRACFNSLMNALSHQVTRLAAAELNRKNEALATKQEDSEEQAEKESEK